MKRPRLYYQETDDDRIPRLRIIWPDGHCQYLFDDDHDTTWGTPCWAEQRNISRPDKDFWFYAYVSFETEVTDVFKKKPEKERG